MEDLLKKIIQITVMNLELFFLHLKFYPHFTFYFCFATLDFNYFNMFAFGKDLSFF